MRQPTLRNAPHCSVLLGCVRVSYAMRTTLTISLSQPLRRSVIRAAKGMGLTESEFVRRAVQQQLWDEAVEASRRLLAPMARAKGIYTDEEVFKVFS
jgi:hypothetical protein